MAIELWLNFTDENGEAKRVLVEGEKFAIGRTPDNDLQIPMNNLSRQHAQIQRFADVFVVSDLGSSNGTMLNDENLADPLALKNGDKLELGGLEMEVEIISDKDKAKGKGGDDNEDDDEPSASSGKASAASASASTGGSSLSPILLIIAPIFGVIILLFLVGVILISRGNNGSDVVQNGKTPEFTRTPKDGDSPTPDKTESPTKTESPPPNNSTLPNNNSNIPPTPESTEEIPTPPKVEGEAEKIGTNAGLFLRKISQNDPKAFLTDAQIPLVTGKISQFKGSSNLAENIRNAKRSAADIISLAESKDLKPQFLANAALTKLGGQRGDVVATAREILEPLSAIVKVFGNDTSDDSLLIIAAFSNNTSGESLQSTAGIFTLNKNAGSVRKIRSIWFFKEKGKLTNEQFDFALRFLAIGAITQNPKEFSVQSEALTF